MLKRLTLLTSLWLVAVSLFSGCADLRSEEARLNGSIGRSIEGTYLENSPQSVVEIVDRANTLEYIHRGRDGCIVSYTVDKKLKTILSWRYLSSPTNCGHIFWFGAE